MRAHIQPVSKKPHKANEPKAPYAAKKPAKVVPVPGPPPAAGVRYMDDAEFKKASEKVFKVHSELFRKLAQ